MFLDPVWLDRIHQISSPSQMVVSQLCLDFNSEFNARATVKKAGASIKQQVMTRRIISRILALETAGRIVEGRSRSVRAELDVIAGDSGDGFRLFRSRNSDRSVWEPSLPS